MSYNSQPTGPPPPQPYLPHGWIQLFHPSGRPYYVNRMTNQSQWEPPLPPPPSQLPPPPSHTPPPPPTIQTTSPITHPNMSLYGAAPGAHRSGGPPGAAQEYTEQSPPIISSPVAALQSPASSSHQYQGGMAGGHQANPAVSAGAKFQSPASCVFSYLPESGNVGHAPPSVDPQHVQPGVPIQGGQAGTPASQFSILPAPLFPPDASPFSSSLVPFSTIVA
jgi:hypothetical protein